MVFITMTSSAQTLTGNALTMRTSIQSYLRSEGYVPEIDNDGDIKFKYEGRTWYIRLQNYDDFVYVDTFYMLDLTDGNMAEVRKAADRAQVAYKFVRCDISGNTLSISVVLPIKTITQYKEMFANILSVIGFTKQKFLEEYNG